MPCLLKIKVIRARSLPVMDRQSSKADAYVEIRFANQYPLRTTIARKTLEPVWNESFRLEINDDAFLQNEPLELRVLDYDSITANDLIGSVYIDLNSLLTDELDLQEGGLGRAGSFDSSESEVQGDGASAVSEDARDSVAGASDADESGSSDDSASGHESFIGETTGVTSTYTRTLGGWFPIYDTMWGIRGELKSQIILQYFGDVNPFNNSSAGIQVFSTPSPCLPAMEMHSAGFISSVVTQIDPEYHWTDSFRTPRASNEARVRVLHRVTGLLRRRMGRKALELGANAIVGYRQWFDFEEEEKTITGRAVGTAVTIGSHRAGAARRRLSVVDTDGASQAACVQPAVDPAAALADTGDGDEPARNRRPSATSQVSHGGNSAPSIHSVTSQASASSGSSLSTSSLQSADNVRNQRRADACEILTFKTFAPGTLRRLGGLVSATAVKLIENDQSRTRELWFDDLRAEIRHHALAAGCTHIVGYTEQVSIWEEVIVLVAYGTAAELDLPAAQPAGSLAAHSAGRPPSPVGSPMGRPADTPATPRMRRRHAHRRNSTCGDSLGDSSGAEVPADRPLGCRMAHAPADRQKLPYPMRFFRCGYCQHKAVPEILLATIDLPLELDVVAGESCMVEAHICRPVRAGAAASMAGAADGDNDGERRAAGKAGAKADARLSGEAYAAHISEALPFIHYDVHRQLLYKLSVHGMNAVFGLKYQFSVGADMIIAVATGTAVYVTGLPTPGPLHIKRNIGVVDDEDRGFMRIQDRIMRLSDANRRRLDRAFRKKRRAMLRLRGRRLASSDEEESGSEGGAGWAQRRRSISARVAVQIDDDADEDLMAALLDIPLPPTFAVCNVERPPLFRRFFDNVSVDPATHSPLALSSSSSSSSSEEVSSSSESSSGSEDVEAARKQALQYLRPELIETLVLVKRATVDPYTNHPNRQLAGLFNAIYLELHANLAYFSRCAIAAVDYTVQVVAESPQDVQVTLTATVVGETHNLPARYLVNAHLAPDVRSLCADVSSMHLERSADASSEHRGAAAIELTTLSYLPSRIITAHVGRVSLHFVQEVHIDPASKGPVGMGAFVFSFVAEVQAMARAHVAARGGMAMVALSIDQVQILRDDRSEAYATMSISGDVVRFKRDF